MNVFAIVGYFLLLTLFSTVSFVLWIRLFIRYFSVGTFHPLSQTIYKLTAFAVTPIHNYITRGLGNGTRYDVPCFTLLIVCELLKYSLISFFFLNQAMHLQTICLATLVDIIVQPCNLLFYAIIIRTLISWLNPYLRNPFVDLIFLVTEPLLCVLRSRLPNMGMIDISPFIAIIGLKVIILLAEGMIGTVLP